MSPDQCSNVVVLAARRSTFVWLLDVLRDWSSVGLISRVHLVNADSLRPGELRVPCTVLDAGATRGVVLQEEVAGRDRTDLVRLCGLTDVADTVAGVRDDEALSLLGSLRTALPGVDVVPLHLIGIALQGAEPGEDVGWLGWHNVAVAPENSLAPTQGVSPIVYSPGDPVRMTHFAAAICTLAGLWAAEPSGPLDARTVSPGRSLMAARTYTRHLSAAAVESELLSRLASVRQGYPAPALDGGSAWVVEDEVGAVTDMADALLDKHSHVLPRHREMPRPTPQKKIGAMEALRMLFAFLGQAIRNAPKAFLDRLVNEVSARTAAFVGGAVFGSGDPEYSVVVNSVRADGLPASWADIDEALEGAAKRVRPGEQSQSPHTDLSGLWKDFVSGGLTLLDAGARSTDLPPRMMGSRRGVVSTAARVAPDPSEAFEPPESVAPYVKELRVASYDVVAARELHEQLGAAGERQPHVVGQASAARAELEDWFGDRERSYTGRVGRTLAKGLHDVRGELTSLSNALRSAQEATDVPSRIEEQQRRLATKLKIVFATAFLAVVAAILVTRLGRPGWLFLVSTLLGITALWLVTSLIMFLRGQRDLFALLHQRNQLASRSEVLRRHLVEAIDDMRRLTRAYRQYLDWAKAFGRFVQAPLGHPAGQADTEMLLGSGFPRNHRFGAAHPEEFALDEASARMRREMFGVGWAGDAWNVFMSDVPSEMGPAAFRIREDPELLWADPGVTRQSLLTTWADAVGSRAQWQGATETLKAKVGSLLRGPGADLAPQLLAHVVTRSGVSGSPESVTYESFISRLDNPAGLEGTHLAFDRAMFSDQAHTTEPWRVAETIAKQPSDNLGRTLVVTQLSRGFNAYDLRLGADVYAQNGTSPSPANPSESAQVSQAHRPKM